MTQLIKKLTYIFDKLNIKNSYDIAVELTAGYNYQFYYNMFDDSKTFSGGSVPNSSSNTVKFEYDGVDFLFDKYDEKNNVDYSIYQKNDINRHCVLIMVNKKEKFACIHAISYDTNCFNKHQLDTFEDNANGSLLLKVTLAFIDKIKTHYDLQYIQLSDNSKKQCKIIK